MLIQYVEFHWWSITPLSHTLLKKNTGRIYSFNGVRKKDRKHFTPTIGSCKWPMIPWDSLDVLITLCRWNLLHKLSVYWWEDPTICSTGFDFCRRLAFFRWSLFNPFSSFGGGGGQRQKLTFSDAKGTLVLLLLFSDWLQWTLAISSSARLCIFCRQRKIISLPSVLHLLAIVNSLSKTS